MPSPRPLVLGIEPGLPERVLDEALSFAADLGCGVMCVFVDESRIPIAATGPDGMHVAAPVSPDVPFHDEPLGESIPLSLQERIGSAAALRGVPIGYRALAGDPATALARAATELDARAIVIGTRKPGLRSAIRLLIAGPVSARLTRHQQIPVIVVPVHEEELP